MVARYDEFLSDGFEWRPALIGEIRGSKVYRGREGWTEYWEDFTAAFADPEYSAANFESP